MLLNISAFTHVGTVREFNQDSILVNGQVLNSGEVNLVNQHRCICFVADGVGGNKAGDFASRFVLENISSFVKLEQADWESCLQEVNQRLLSESGDKEELKGTATTLTGLVAEENTFFIIHVGDSQMWLQRNGTVFKVTNDQVLNEHEPNSPLTSYFGGTDDNLKFFTDIFVREIAVEDIFLICSDGLLKSLNYKTIKAILKGDHHLQAQAQMLLDNCLQNGVDDNVSVILIQRTE